MDTSEHTLKANFEAVKAVVGCEQVAKFETELHSSGRTLVGSCPLKGHEDSSPSFYLYPIDRKSNFYPRWKCFGCGRGGDVVDLWQSLYGPEGNVVFALQALAEHFNVKLWGEEELMDPEELERVKAERKVRESMTSIVITEAFEQNVLPMIARIKNPARRYATLKRCVREWGL